MKKFNAGIICFFSIVVLLILFRSSVYCLIDGISVIEFIKKARGNKVFFSFKKLNKRRKLWDYFLIVVMKFKIKL